MKHFLLLPLIAVIAIAEVYGQTADEKFVTAAEKRWSDASRAYDVKTLRTLLADDYVGVSVTGITGNKTATLQRTESVPAAVKQHNSERTMPAREDVKVRIYGPVAVVTGEALIPGPNGFGTRFTRVWVKSNDEWKLTTFHATRIAAGPNAPGF